MKLHPSPLPPSKNRVQEGHSRRLQRHLCTSPSICVSDLLGKKTPTLTMQPDTQSLLRDGGLGDEGDGEEGEDDGWLQISREYVRTRRA